MRDMVPDFISCPQQAKTFSKWNLLDILTVPEYPNLSFDDRAEVLSIKRK